MSDTGDHGRELEHFLHVRFGTAGWQGGPMECHRRAQVLLVVSLLASILIVVSVAGSANASLSSTAATPRTVSHAPANYYVALGDSFSSGEGNKASGWVNWSGARYGNANDGCDRSSQGYPELVHTWLAKHSTLGTNAFALYACSGATTTDMYAGSPAASVGLKGVTYNSHGKANNGEPPEFSHNGELASARLVTLTAGGNDISFATVAEMCVLPSLTSTVLKLFAARIAGALGIATAVLIDYLKTYSAARLCGPDSPISSVRNLTSNISHLAPVLDATYRQLKDQAPYATIDVLEYPDLLPPVSSMTETELAHGCEGLPGSTLKYLSGAEASLNLVIAQAASGEGLTIVDPNSSFLGTGGHTLCSTSSRWFNGIELNFVGSYHPNKQGQASLASAVEVANAPTTVAGQLSDVKTVVSDVEGTSCALLTTGRVDCWGQGEFGQLGDGTSYTSGNFGSAIPVAVEGLGGNGILTGVASISTDAYGTFCAVLTTGRVDCWGFGQYGELGDGLSLSSAVPVSVVSVGGAGTLQGVASLSSTRTYAGAGFCALLVTGHVDCWGYGPNGQLGDGTFHTSPPSYGSASPVAVVGVGGTRALTGVASVTGSGSGGTSSYCALLTSGRVDCWGYGIDGELGNGTFYTTGAEGSAVPVPVAAVDEGGTGTLTGVTSIVSATYDTYCGLLATGRIDCWGAGPLGDGSFTSSALPVAVVGVDGTRLLANAASLAGDMNGSYCALLSSGRVDCWGNGSVGELGNGEFYTSGIGGSAGPVAVEGVGGTGTLESIASLVGDGNGFCAVVTSGHVDCWGYGAQGQLGNGIFYTPPCNCGSAVPVSVVGLSGAGNLVDVASLTSQAGNYFALLTTGRVDSWGGGFLGEATSSPSAIPVAVAGIGG